MIESLEGYPKPIIAALGDQEKRQKVDALLEHAGKYFHAGRHVSTVGSGDAGKVKRT